MVIYGLTGGVGMGKSTAAQRLAGLGLSVVDTDVIAREVVAPGSEGLAAVTRAFGEEVIQPDGSLNRKRLAELVFADPKRRHELEELLHPRIREQWQAILATWRAEGVTRAVVVIPLLFETGAETGMGHTICVSCRPETQRRRLQSRGWTDGEIDGRIAAQWPIERKIEKSDFVVWSEGLPEATGMQLGRILEQPAPASG